MKERKGKADQIQEMIEAYEQKISRLIAKLEQVKKQVVAPRQRRLDRILDSLSYPLIVIDAKSYAVVFANQAALGGRGESGGHTCYGLTHRRSSPCLNREYPCPLEIVKKTGKPVVVEHSHYDAEGGQHVVEIHAFPVFGEQGEVVEVVEYCFDITQRREAEQKLAYLATHDALTGLPNRTLFNIHLQLEMEHAVRNRKRLAVMLLDLDGFKEINDTVGHDAGDEALKIVARRLESSLRQSDTVARLGGDEFLVLIPALSSGRHAGGMAQKAITALSAPMVLEGEELIVGTSLGIAIFPDDGNDPEALIRCADAAMYQVKGAGGNGYRFCGLSSAKVA